MEVKYYRRKAEGGWSPCILGNNAIIPRHSEMNTLPNCVSYCTGRFNEFNNQGSCKYLGNSNANWFMNWAKPQGLQTGKTPRVGAAIVWDNGNCGHCAIVERVNKNGSIYVSESGWSAKSYYWNATLSGANYTVGESWLNNGKYKLLGFIYQPLLKTMYVNAKSGLNERLANGTNYEIVGFYPYKSKVNIYAIRGNWGATEKGWVCMDYLQDNEIVEEVKVEEPKEPLPMEEEILKEIEKIAEEKKEDIPPYYEEKEKNNSLLWLIQKFIEFIKKLFKNK